MEQMVCPTGVAAMPIYEFYTKFATEPERDPWVMVKVVRYAFQNTPICSDGQLAMYRYCCATAVFRNSVMHNNCYDDILECYQTFAKTAQSTNDHITQVDPSLCDMSSLMTKIGEINNLIKKTQTKVCEIAGILVAPTIGTYDVDYCHGTFGRNLNKCKIILHRTHPELTVSDMGVVMFNRWNGINIEVICNNEKKQIKKCKIRQIEIVELRPESG